MRRAAVLVVLATLPLALPPSASANDVRVESVDVAHVGRPVNDPTQDSGPPREVAPLQGRAMTADDNRASSSAQAQTAATPFSAPSVPLNFAGIGFNGALPPDPSGEVGTTQYVQMANTLRGARVAVYNKLTGQKVVGFRLGSLAGGGPCKDGLGDGVPIFDQIDNRWILTEISTRKRSLCIYVSATDDATSSYTRYRIGFTVFPDYPKWGVMPNALYLGFNNSGFSDPIVAINKVPLLAGTTPTANDVVIDNIAPLPSFGFQLLSPVDLDGAASLALATAPGIFVRHDVQDKLQYVEMTPDFVNGVATVNGPIDVNFPASTFDSRLCGLFKRGCIPQRHTRVKLDPLREPVMQRPLLRVIGGTQHLVGSMSVDATGNDRAGVFWFDLSRPDVFPGGAWSIANSGTFAPADGLHRWMPSIGVDGTGNLAIGYSTSSHTTFPAIAITGRKVTDPAGQMTQDETVIRQGTGSQTFANRWGDYSEMSVDPTDDTTFWYTNEYIDRHGLWHTRIASFTLGP